MDIYCIRGFLETILLGGNMRTNDLLKKYFKNQKMMRVVLLCLIPIILLATYLYGLRVLFLLAVVLLAGTLAEYFWEKKQGNKASEAIFVTCVLYTLTLPAKIPFWIAVLGILFGVFFGKLVFGGFGKNIFNPALVGRAFIYVNFPEPLTISWNEISSSFPGGMGMYMTNEIDVISKATPMILFKNYSEAVNIQDLIFGLVPGSIGETSKILIILAAVYLIYKKAASWQIMAGSLIGFVSACSILYFFTDLNVTSPLYGMMLGGFMFGTVFMATDPVSAAKTETGKWIYGIIIGLVTVLIRVFSLFNGGMMFAILIGNTFAPIIDYFVKESKIRKKVKLEVTS
jgi:Na+-transporting NADH:ubiquinone oxidoreductase subunit B